MSVGNVRSRRLLLKKREPVQLVARFAEVAGWEYVGALDRDPDQLINHEMKWQVDASTSVHFIVDDTGVDQSGELRYLVVLGADREQVEQVRKSVEDARIDVWKPAELNRIADLSFGSGLPDEQVRAMLRLGLGAPLTATPKVEALFERGTRDPEPIVRFATLHAIAQAEWPGCLDLVRGLADDEHPDVAELAEMVVQAFADEGLA
ncbi:hypothetical protein SAMN02982929_03286 [Saccharopolyspora kobensis]|uniref:HEAT repeat protein n=1 Tax=Saccharopolyspora kobensis TaxID=146035 RepID=A0A1H6CB86_9PSEU|nr:hypothetical protein [Saccharopolyspora kobensis]SEG70204.1 hypothetical protein SAMN02982929_03286 [Saccharopolyspora kobensis]SFC34413.1 hypothetical protein SAMN05216506_101528 [Saccharopolyspora kobensis]